MRKDMKKVLIERPRVGGGWVDRKKNSKIRPIEADDYEGPKRAKITDGILGRKSQTDLFGPLIRFLNKRLGRKWDDVWSEICEHNKDHMGYHLRRHVIRDFVHTKITFDDDDTMRGNYGWPVSMWRDEFYVDPQDGKLKRHPKRSYRREQWPLQIYTLECQDYYCHQGIWYRVKLKYPSDYESDELRYDIFSDGYSYGWHGRQQQLQRYGKLVYCVDKQQAGSKECKRLNALREAGKNK